MFFWIVCGWILFRTRELSLFSGYIQQPLISSNSIYFYTIITTLFIFIFYAVPLLVIRFIKEAPPLVKLIQDYTVPFRLIGYSLAALLIILFSAEQSADFYYFQF